MGRVNSNITKQIKHVYSFNKNKIYLMVNVVSWYAQWKMINNSPTHEQK